MDEDEDDVSSRGGGGDGDVRWKQVDGEVAFSFVFIGYLTLMGELSVESLSQ